MHRHWVPSTTGPFSQIGLPPALLGFAGLEDSVTLVTGTNHKHAEPGHIPGRGIALSSSHDLTWVEENTDAKGFRGQIHPEPSLDALVAEHWRGQTLFDSLEVGICRKGPYRSNSSWKRGGTRLMPHEPSPARLFERLFGGGRDNAKAHALSFDHQKSLLDGLIEDSKKLKQEVGRADVQRIEAHLEGLRSMERRLAERQAMRRGLLGRAQCVPRGSLEDVAPKSWSKSEFEAYLQSNFNDGTGREEKQAKSALMSDILATALACDLSRVFSYEWSATQSHAVYWETGARMEHHPMNHAMGDSDAYAKTIAFIMDNLAYLARALARFTEGEGTLLDRTLILATSEHASSRKHNWIDHPLLLVGRAGGNLRAGQHIRDAHPNDNYAAPQVLLAATRAVNVFVPHLGQEDMRSARRTATPYPGLLV